MNRLKPIQQPATADSVARAVILTALILLVGMSGVSIWAMGRKPPVPGEQKKAETKQTGESVSKERTYTDGGKTFTVVSLRDKVKLEDILYNTEIEFKKDATTEQIEGIFKKYGIEVIHRNDKDKEYLVNMPDGKLTSQKKELRKEPGIDTVSVNPFSITDYDVWMMDKHIEVQFKSGVSDKTKEEIIKKYQTKISDIYEGRYDLEILSGKRVPEVINIFRKDPDILSAELVLTGKLQDVTKSNDEYVANQWYLEQSSDIDIDMTEAWNIVTATTIIKIAVIDSGVSLNNNDLKGTMWLSPGCNLVKGEDSSSPEDKLGHGTGVFGIIGATTNNGKDISGICWNRDRMMALIIPVKILNTDEFNSKVLVEGIEYAIKQKVGIINISMSAYSNDSLKSAIQEAQRQGIIVVCSAGNDHIEMNSEGDVKYRQVFPAGYDGVISVGSVNGTGVKSRFSNYGDAIAVQAPGESIYTIGLKNTYTYEDGTSFAAPIVAGIVGLMKSEKPDLTNEQIIKILKETKKNSIVNAYNAIKKVQELKGIQKGKLEVSKEGQLADRKMSAMGMPEVKGQEKKDISKDDMETTNLLEKVKTDIKNRKLNDEFPYFKNSSDMLYEKDSVLKLGRKKDIKAIPIFDIIITSYPSVVARKNALEALEMLSEKDNNSVVEVISKALKDKNITVRRTASYLLVKLGAKEKALPVLEEIAMINDLNNKQFVKDINEDEYWGSEFYNLEYNLEKVKNESHLTDEDIKQWKQEYQSYKEAIILGALHDLCIIDSPKAKNIIEKVTTEGASERIRNEAKKILKIIQKNKGGKK